MTINGADRNFSRFENGDYIDTQAQKDWKIWDGSRNNLGSNLKDFLVEDCLQEVIEAIKDGSQKVLSLDTEHHLETHHGLDGTITKTSSGRKTITINLEKQR